MPPWRVRDLLAHVRVVLAWLPGMLAVAEPDPSPRLNTGQLVDAGQYYRPDRRFGPEVNATRIALAQQHAAAQSNDRVLLDDFTATWHRVVRLGQEQPEGRVVLTRHGEAMLLSQFLLTRVVEVAVHGFDLANALRRRSWLTPEAGGLLEELLLGPHVSERAKLGWDQITFLRKATGRVATS